MPNAQSKHECKSCRNMNDLQSKMGVLRIAQNQAQSKCRSSIKVASWAEVDSSFREPGPLISGFYKIKNKNNLKAQ